MQSEISQEFTSNESFLISPEKESSKYKKIFLKYLNSLQLKESEIKSLYSNKNYINILNEIFRILKFQCEIFPDLMSAYDHLSANLICKDKIVDNLIASYLEGIYLIISKMINFLDEVFDSNPKCFFNNMNIDFDNKIQLSYTNLSSHNSEVFKSDKFFNVINSNSTSQNNLFFATLSNEKLESNIINDFISKENNMNYSIYNGSNFTFSKSNTGTNTEKKLINFNFNNNVLTNKCANSNKVSFFKDITESENEKINNIVYYNSNHSKSKINNVLNYNLNSEFDNSYSSILLKKSSIINSLNNDKIKENMFNFEKDGNVNSIQINAANTPIEEKDNITNCEIENEIDKIDSNNKQNKKLKFKYNNLSSIKNSAENDYDLSLIEKIKLKVHKYTQRRKSSLCDCNTFICENCENDTNQKIISCEKNGSIFKKMNSDCANKFNSFINSRNNKFRSSINKLSSSKDISNLFIPNELLITSPELNEKEENSFNPQEKENTLNKSKSTSEILLNNFPFNKQVVSNPIDYIYDSNTYTGKALKSLKIKKKRKDCLNGFFNQENTLTKGKKKNYSIKNKGMSLITERNKTNDREHYKNSKETYKSVLMDARCENDCVNFKTINENLNKMKSKNYFKPCSSLDINKCQDKINIINSKIRQRKGRKFSIEDETKNKKFLMRTKLFYDNIKHVKSKYNENNVFYNPSFKIMDKNFMNDIKIKKK